MSEDRSAPRGWKGRRRRARVAGRPLGGHTHNDLENLVVALLAENGDAWPNALYRLGYRLHHFDASVYFAQPAGTGTPPVRRQPDAVAHHRPRNLALVLECKEGRDPGFRQLPEGWSATAEEWAAALALPRGSMNPLEVRGVLVADEDVLTPKEAEIRRLGTSWLRVTGDGMRLDPNAISDKRIVAKVAELPADPWPLSFVPFSHDPGQRRARVIAAIGPLLLEDAAGGNDLVGATELARRTHRAVWNVTDGERQKGWVRVVADALKWLGEGALKAQAVYDPGPHALRLQHVKRGTAASAAVLSDLQKGLQRAYREADKTRRRVPTKRTGAAQLPLWGDEEL